MGNETDTETGETAHDISDEFADLTDALNGRTVLRVEVVCEQECGSGRDPGTDLELHTTRIRFTDGSVFEVTGLPSSFIGAGTEA